MCDEVRGISYRNESVKKNYTYINRAEALATRVELMLHMHKYIAKQQIPSAECVELFVINFNINVNLDLGLHYWKQSMSYMRDKFNTEQRSSKFLLAVKVPVSSGKEGHVYTV